MAGLLPLELEFLVLGHMIHHEQTSDDATSRQRERKRRAEGRKARAREHFAEQRGLN